MAARFLALVVVVLALAACPKRATHRRAADGPPEDEAPRVTVEERTLSFTLDDGAAVALGAELYLPEHHDDDAPAVLFVPGGGNISRKGRQPGDGVRNYEKPVEVTAALATAVARAGLLALAYDKRTCSPHDDALCARNPITDVDAEGPVALARDVDAACALLAEEPRFDGRVILWAHGQGAAVALSSTCAERAAAIVLVAPIPRRVDLVIVDSLAHRERELRREAKRRAGTPAAEKLLVQADALRNAAASRAATFDSMRKGQFADDARVQGASLAFWKGWLALTSDPKEQLFAKAAPRVVVVGKSDVQYAPRDRAAIVAWGKEEGVAALELEGADHHLLKGDALDDASVALVLDAVTKALTPPSM